MSTTYSYNEEQPTQATMENMYKWLTANSKGLVRNSSRWEYEFAHKKLTEHYIDEFLPANFINNAISKSSSAYGSPFHLGEWDNNLFLANIGDGKTLHAYSRSTSALNLEYDASNKQFTCNRQTDSTEGWLIPLTSEKHIYQITFDVQLIWCHGYGWDTSLLGFVGTNTGRFVTKVEKNIKWMNNQTGEGGEEVKDYNWHTFSYYVGLTNVSYLGFSCANNKCRFKNIKVLCCDVD